jgi:hypothetical protein
MRRGTTTVAMAMVVVCYFGSVENHRRNNIDHVYAAALLYGDTKRNLL